MEKKNTQPQAILLPAVDIDHCQPGQFRPDGGWPAPQGRGGTVINAHGGWALKTCKNVQASPSSRRRRSAWPSWCPQGKNSR